MKIDILPLLIKFIKNIVCFSNLNRNKYEHRETQKWFNNLKCYDYIFEYINRIINDCKWYFWSTHIYFIVFWNKWKLSEKLFSMKIEESCNFSTFLVRLTIRYRDFTLYVILSFRLFTNWTKNFLLEIEN